MNKYKITIEELDVIKASLPEITQEELWPTPEEYPAYHFLQQIKGSNELPRN